MIVAMTRAGPDPVAAADERLLDAVLVEERRLERLRVARPELEDVAHLDRSLEAKRPPQTGHTSSSRRLADVREPRLVVPPCLDAEQMPAVAVRAGDELALAQRLVGDDLDLDTDRAE